MLKTLKYLPLLAALAAGTAYAQTASRIGGEITKAGPDSITLKHTSGESVTLAAPASVPVIAFRKLSLADVKTGSFVGVGAKIGPDGKQRAVQVVVFPESARGTGEGHRGWNMGSDSTMTNANVDAIVDAKSGRDLKLSYKGGQQEIAIPPDARILTYGPAARADVQAGKKTVVNATDDGQGHYAATRIAIEKDGVAPPM
jgi:hypothetical protein